MFKKIFITLLSLNAFTIKTVNNSNLDLKLTFIESELRKFSSKLNKAESNILDISSTIENLKSDIKNLKEIYKLKEKITNLKFSEKINKLVEESPWVVLDISSSSTKEEAKEAFIKKINESKIDYLIIKSAYKNFLKINYNKENFDLEFNNLIEDILKEKKELEGKIKAQEVLKRKIDKKINKLSNILFTSILDIISTLNELNKINSTASYNEDYIYYSSLSDLTLNFFPSLTSLFSNLKSTFNFKVKNSPKVKITKLLSLINNISNIVLCSANIKKIVEPNIEYKIKDREGFMLVQAIWLLINKMSPYILFSKDRINNENLNIFDTFDKPEKIKNKTIENFYFRRELFNFSEILRKLMIISAEE